MGCAGGFFRLVLVLSRRLFSSRPMLRTDLTQLLGIEHPIMCAGMGFFVTGPDLAAAVGHIFAHYFVRAASQVSNAGGIGTIGAVGLNPDGLRQVIRELKAKLAPGKPYGVATL